MRTSTSGGVAARLKRADLGGQGQDGAFEASFANIAHAYIQDRAPQLLEYEIGFQLVDRNDDDSKAVGIFGFKVGSTWLNAPVFWINGQLKGHELLYIKDRDAFVPLKENWINYLLAKKPASIGDGVARNTRVLGVRYPDLYRALQSPHKYASLAAEADAARAKLAAAGVALRPMPDWAIAGVAALAKAARRLDAAAELRLPAVVKTGGAKAAVALKAALDTYPTLRSAFDAAYPAAQVKEALDHVRAHPGGGPRPRPKVARTGSVLEDPRSKVAVHRFGGFGKSASALLDDADREALVRAGVLIKDARDDAEVSRAYAVDVKVQFDTVFQNAVETGVYDVLMKDGSTEKCLVVLGPQGPGRKMAWATVVRLDGARRAYTNVHPSLVYVAKQYRGWGDWFDALPDADAAPDAGRFLVLCRNGTATCPVSTSRDYGTDASGARYYDANFDTYARRPRPGGAAPYNYRDYDSGYFADGERLHLGGAEGSTLRSRGGDVYCPPGCKIVRLRPEQSASGDASGPAEGAGVPPIELGDALDVERTVYRKYAELRLRSDGSRTRIGDGGSWLSDDDAAVGLVVGHGLREDAARDLLKRAHAASGTAARGATFAVKYADGYPGARGLPYLTGSAPAAPALIDPVQANDDVLGAPVNTQHPYEESLDVPDLRSDPGNRQYYDPITPDPMAMRAAGGAAARGQKDVLDTAMIGNLLKTTRDDLMIDQHIGDLMKGLDRVGRLLFALYWHGDKFAERFGDADMPELEDAMRNTFENLGDLTLELKQRTVDADPGESASTIDLSDAANQ